MNQSIFRKASLDRLANPDRLDKIVRISTLRSWIALIALLALTGMLTVWAYVGRISTTVVGKGVIIRSGGLLTVVSRGAGLLADIKVEAGDHVHVGQVLATISQPALREKERLLEQSIDEERRRQELELTLKSSQATIAREAIERQRANTQQEVKVLQERSILAEQDIPVTDQLFTKGLVTRHQTIVARQSLVDLQSKIAEQQARLKQFDQQANAVNMEVRQTELDMQGRLTNLKQSREASSEELSRVEEVVAPADGEVVELRVSAGGTVTEGEPILTVQPNDGAALQVVAYVPATLAKECHVSMQVQVSPSAAKREEFGYMEGRVIFVSDYPTTSAAIMRQFQNESLISALSNGAPVSEVRATLEKDETTSSGFRWSSSKGPQMRITPGTISNVSIVTRTQSPVTLLMPWLKSRMSGD